MSSPHITELRQQLLDTLKDLRNRESPMEPDRARAVAQVASVLVDTAKVAVPDGLNSKPVTGEAK